MSHFRDNTNVSMGNALSVDGKKNTQNTVIQYVYKIQIQIELNL